ncbi:hypothetical protein ACJJI3_18455 [Microbulbifer sp. ZKSA004]|uniref:hypothetical protein n=1 Tax=Microbulbifer sp. ZKSA004 TaxID=3243389 RepID=UPI0040390BA2
MSNGINVNGASTTNRQELTGRVENQRDRGNTRPRKIGPLLDKGKQLLAKKLGLTPQKKEVPIPEAILVKEGDIPKAIAVDIPEGVTPPVATVVDKAPAGRSEAPAGRSEAPAGRPEAPAGRPEAPAGRSEAPAGRSEAPADSTAEPETVTVELIPDKTGKMIDRFELTKKYQEQGFKF